MIDTTSKQRTFVREQVGEGKTTCIPVFVIPASYQKPVLSGSRGGFFTSGGTRISHPSAYSKKGWSNMIYHRSTLSISVGSEWLKSQH